MIDVHSLQPGEADQPVYQTFAVEVDASDTDLVHLLASPPGSRSEPTLLWSRRFETAEDRVALFDAIHSCRYDLTFLGHLTMIFGSAEMDRIVDDVVVAAREKQRLALDEAARRARSHQKVGLYAPDDRRGHALELRRRSRKDAEWRVSYDRPSERDRLCDWLRWQKPRFLDFLAHAAEHGGESLTRLLIDQMFETESRVKKEGRGAGGLRPLRMWRGD